MEDDRTRKGEASRGVDLSDPDQAEALLSHVYEDLRAMAARRMRRERSHSLRPTALVHEAYLRMARGAPLEVEGRAHFMRIAGRVMRRVLVDEARRRLTLKRGGGQRRVTLTTDLLAEDSEHDLLELHEALQRLGALDPRLEQLVELRFFSGFTLDETAAILGVSPRKAAKDWSSARLWLRRELSMAG